MSFYLYAAPMQGHTDPPYRHFHTKLYGEADAYFTPFLRVERGEVRHRDLKNLYSELNENHFLIPQIIFNSEKEFRMLVDAVMESGANEIDINMGCPYPMQTNHGRGAALLSNIDLLRSVFDTINKMDDISFSIKMRAGLASPEDSKGLIDLINDTRLAHVTFHPRVAKQKYDGELDMETFEYFLERCNHPLIFNGDVRTPSDIISMKERYPGLAGIMCGRGLLARPSLFQEIRDGHEWQKDRRLDMMLKFHDRLKQYYSERLCGDAQLLAKLQSFWEYAEDEIGRKTWKAIRKATSMVKYNAAVSTI